MHCHRQRTTGNSADPHQEHETFGYDLLKRYNLKRCNRIWAMYCMMSSMTDSDSSPLSAIQISPDCSADRDSRTCHAQSYESWLDYALTATQISDSIVMFEIVTPEQVMSANVKLEEIAGNTHGFVGADLAQLCTESALTCIREKMDLIDLEEETIDAEILDSMAVTQVHLLLYWIHV